MMAFEGKKLFTPGPANCSRYVKEAMLVDCGSRDNYFMNVIRDIRKDLLNIAGVDNGHFTTVLMQGSGTYCLEAALQTTTPRKAGKVLILSNGAYGLRMGKMCKTAGIDHVLQEYEENAAIDPQSVKDFLDDRDSTEFTTIVVVHCETTSGVINPILEIGKIVKDFSSDVVYLVDAMSSFGAWPIDVIGSKIDYLVSSSNKCLQGTPGFAFCICKTKHLLSCRGNCRVLSLDMVDQHEFMDRTGQFRFTPPTHVLLAFREALIEYWKEGGLEGRNKRYKENNEVLNSGMKRLGFRKLLAERDSSPIITSFHYPKSSNFLFQVFYEKLQKRGQVIYPGKVSSANCFRIGCIGDLNPADFHVLLKNIQEVLLEMNVPIEVE